ncbi:MAG: hypothetical protein V2I27_03900 [Erythrobacter sp.]|nr:hypothetical protein [Erythrobacter sp.]
MQRFRIPTLTRPLTLGLAATTLACGALGAAPVAAQDEPLPELPALPSVGEAPMSPAPMSQAEIETLPPEYRDLPTVSETTTTTVGEDGIETVTRTRRITETAPMPGSVQYRQAQTQQTGEAAYGYAPYAYAPAPVVFDRSQWLAECRRRTEGLGRRDRGRIIGSLLGALGGGLIGNSVAGDGSRLGGTLLGAGVGAAAGALAGDAIDDRRDREDYDCADVLESYLAQPSVIYAGAPRIASRTIPAPGYAYQGYAPAQYGYSYGFAPAYGGYDYGYAPQQPVLVPIQTMQPQRVLVRETVREEMVPAVRSIPRPAADPVPVREPIPVKGGEPRMIKY